MTLRGGTPRASPVPLNTVDGFAADNAICENVIRRASAPEQQSRPWESFWKRSAAERLQRQAFVLAVAMILARYRTQSS